MKPRVLISTGGGDAANYIAAIEAAGGEADARYLPTPDLTYDGLLLAGGDDIDPIRFGEENRGSVGIDPARDAAELTLLDTFLGAGRPVMGICRGHQVINVWLGGSLIQDICPILAPAHRGGRGDKVHLIHTARGSLLRRLYGPEFAVNSAHHQALGRLGRGLTAAAHSTDGLVEAVEHHTLPLISVQFHPERMTGALARPDTVDGGGVFRAFLELCDSAAERHPAAPKRRLPPLK